MSIKQTNKCNLIIVFKSTVDADEIRIYHRLLLNRKNFTLDESDNSLLQVFPVNAFDGVNWFYLEAGPVDVYSMSYLANDAELAKVLSAIRTFLANKTVEKFDDITFEIEVKAVSAETKLPKTTTSSKELSPTLDSAAQLVFWEIQCMRMSRGLLPLSEHTAKSDEIICEHQENHRLFPERSALFVAMSKQEQMQYFYRKMNQMKLIIGRFADPFMTRPDDDFVDAITRNIGNLPKVEKYDNNNNAHSKK